MPIVPGRCWWSSATGRTRNVELIVRDRDVLTRPVDALDEQLDAGDQRLAG